METEVATLLPSIATVKGRMARIMIGWGEVAMVDMVIVRMVGKMVRMVIY